MESVDENMPSLFAAREISPYEFFCIHIKRNILYPVKCLLQTIFVKSSIVDAWSAPEMIKYFIIKTSSCASVQNSLWSLR